MTDKIEMQIIKGTGKGLVALISTPLDDAFTADKLNISINPENSIEKKSFGITYCGGMATAISFIVYLGYKIYSNNN